MMSTLPANPVDAWAAKPTKTSSPWIGTALWLALTLLLCATNTLTLLDHDFRNKTYSAVAQIAASPALRTIGFSAIAKHLQERSPAALERIAVQRATVRLLESSAVLQREVGKLTGEKARLLTDRQHLHKQLRASQALVALHKQRISTLGMRVLGRAARSVTRHLVALPGHALPVLSATVAMGVSPSTFMTPARA